MSGYRGHEAKNKFNFRLAIIALVMDPRELVVDSDSFAKNNITALQRSFAKNSWKLGYSAWFFPSVPWSIGL